MKKITFTIMILIVILFMFVIPTGAIADKTIIHDDGHIRAYISSKNGTIINYFPANGDTYSVESTSPYIWIYSNKISGTNWRTEIYLTSNSLIFGWNYINLKNDRTGSIDYVIWIYIFPTYAQLTEAQLSDVPECPGLNQIEEENINLYVGEYLEIIIPIERQIEDLYYTPGMSFLKATSFGSEMKYKYICYYGEDEGFDLDLKIGYYLDDVFVHKKTYHIKMYPSKETIPENLTETQLYLQSIIDKYTDSETGEIDTMCAMTELYIIMANKIEQMSALSYQNGYEKGRNDSVTSITNGSNLYGGIRAIIMSPIEFFRTVFNFEIDFGQGFHFNIYYFFTFLITIAIFIFVIKKLIGK